MIQVHVGPHTHLRKQPRRAPSWENTRTPISPDLTSIEAGSSVRLGVGLADQADSDQ